MTDGPACELHVVRAGALTTVQDLGRPGWAHLGVPRAGALDPPALVRANRLVGNLDGAAGLETTLTGCDLRFTGPVRVAVTGAGCSVTVDGSPVGWGEAVGVPAGGVVQVGHARVGVRSYLAVAGGVDVAPVLGSRSTDTLSGLGPPPLGDGSVLTVGRALAVSGARAVSAADADAGDTEPGRSSPDVVRPRLRLGPRDDWFTPEAVADLTDTEWTVSPASNRVGVRLDGPALNRCREGELPSEGVVLGAVQVPSDGRPLVFLADHPTTGGYPVVAVVEPEDLPALAQARPGARLRFRDLTNPTG